ncbi:hypothetical protein QE152_g19916 [Popillia japonica]|uniref:Uncharacterized protein n=1 Tax=Popillia japonica TaxID=7064 RepID=A0AAW1KNR3_POPJA
MARISLKTNLCCRTPFFDHQTQISHGDECRSLETAFSKRCRILKNSHIEEPLTRTTSALFYHASKNTTKPFENSQETDNISTLLPRIKKYNEAIREFAGNPENFCFVQGFIDVYRELFITEFNRVESKNPADEDVSEKQELKRRNVTKAIDDLFGDLFGNVLVTHSLEMDFDVNLVKKLDETIGKDLIRDAGVYRRCDARPQCYGFNYLDPDDIECCLEKLFEDIN